jgi:DNA (cytosine-5)-methyltransferase 1
MSELLYDVYCGGGGATRGYQQAGFRVIGIDNKPQPRYCGDGFIQMDAMEFFRRYLLGEYEEASAFHASPPCQAYSLAGTQWRKSGVEYPDLVAETREALVKTGKPYIIENVPGAPLIDPIVLNGAMFGLLVHRKRLFETNFPLPFVLLPQNKKPVKMGRPVKQGDVIQPVGNFSNVQYAREQMGIDWMTQAELAQAIPPAYTEWIGKRLMEAQ